MAKKIHEFEILRTGEFTDANGTKVSITKDILSELASNYDSVKFPSPLVAGHPKDNDPALGWTDSLKVVGDKLMAFSSKVHKNLKKSIKEGGYKKISVSIFNENSPANPIPGKKYLRHVGFLGAVAPAVPGLETVSLSNDEKDILTIDLSYAERATTSFMGRLRDFFIEKFGLDDANKVIPQWEIDSIRDAQAREEAEKQQIPQFNEPNEDIDMPKKLSDEQIAQLQTDLAASNAAKERLELELSSQSAKARKAEIISFCDQQIKDGKLAPALKNDWVDLMTNLPEDELEFSEGKKSTLLDKAKTLLVSQSKFMDFSEKSKPNSDPTKPVNFTAPTGQKVDKKDLDKLAEAKAYAADNNVSLSEAAIAVGA